MKLQKSIIILFLLMLFAPCALAKGRKQSWQSEADTRKSDYTYLEAQRRSARDDNDAYFELLQRAYELNPHETTVAQELGLYYFILSNGDSTLMTRGYDMMEQHFNADPGDYYSSIVFGNINDRIGNYEKSLEVWRRLHDLFPEKLDATIRLADALGARSTDQAKQREALELLDKIRTAEGPSLALTSRRVSAYMNLRDTVSIKNEVLQFISDTPASADSRVFAGDVYVALGQPDTALMFYNEACVVDPTSGLAYYKLAEYYKESGDSAGYDREVFHALQLPDVELDTKLDILTGYVRKLYTDSLQQGRINELFNTMIDLYPHEARVHDLYSTYFVAVEDYKSAAEHQEYVLDTDPSDYQRWRSLIGLYFADDDYAKAADAAVRAIKLFPDEVLLYLSGGEAYRQAGDYDAAEGLYDAASESDRLDILTKSQLLTARGDLAYKRGNLERAVEYYDSALVVNPLNSTAMNNCAYFLACDGVDLQRAEKMSKRSLEIDAENTSSLDTYAWIQFKLKNYAIAKEYIDKTLELSDEPSAELYEHAGDIYYMNDMREEAVDFWKKALELDADNKKLQLKINLKSLKIK